MFKKFTARLTLLSVFVVPINDPKGWEILSYKKIPSNTVSWSKKGMAISVRNSASPVIFPLKSIKTISKISFKGRIEGGLKFPDNAIQGSKGADDFEVRIGLVIPGEKRLSWIERKIAPDWVMKLQSLAPKDAGIEKVLFLNLSSQKLAWKEREHPLSKYFEERIVGMATKEFNIVESFKEPIQVVALWISVDGDDLKQRYETILSEIQIEER